MLEIGTNSYINKEFANEYISSRYRSNNKDRKRWEEISESDKEVLLINACDELERLHFQGRKALLGQALAFPRLPYQYGKVEEVAPINIKYAQVELALWLSDDKKQESQEKRSNLQKQGVKSFSVGDLSESYGENANVKSGISLCTKAMDLVRPYLSGGFSVC